MEYRQRQPYLVDEKVLASNGIRFANYIIDYIFQIILFVGLVFVVALVAAFNGNELFIEKMENMNRLHEYVLGAIIVLIYYNLFEIFFSATIGKFITQTIVVNEFGEKPSYQDIMLRTVCRLIPFEQFSFLGTPGKGWHDKLSRTYVVDKNLLRKQKEIFYSLDKIGAEE
ncbi:RDD family protein [Flavobacterium sp. NST-5]|uniref:RDD family protein n=1 Tax=Flavobacterium ichthyis TaxID=2698827 RepID=A0ABW9ZE36_9FLAO|nr:RDD family protein [Flavobacterium ichthyis]NBL65562.1 RDD family protein [Flavobacterium ichthyis]